MEQTAYYQNKLKTLKQAIDGFAKLMQIDLESMSEFERDVYKNASVQKFEYSIELFWKVAKLYLTSIKGIDESSPRAVIKSFYRESSISNETYESLLKMILHRNLLSHLYDPDQFEEIYNSLKDHSKVLNQAYEAFS